jgi:hypothetical protein
MTYWSMLPRRRTFVRLIGGDVSEASLLVLCDWQE